jgi:hypothetical protein
MIREMDSNSFWVLALRQEDKQKKWITAIVQVYSKENPLIQKVKLYKNFVPKNSKTNRVQYKNARRFILNSSFIVEKHYKYHTE